MDDLVLQFDGTDAGKRFIEAWKRARIIVDTGGGHSGTPPTLPHSARDTEAVKIKYENTKRPLETEAVFYITKKLLAKFEKRR